MNITIETEPSRDIYSGKTEPRIRIECDDLQVDQAIEIINKIKEEIKN